MKTAILTLIAAAGLTSAQFPGEPACAIPCLTSAISIAGCALSDVGCQCGKSQLAIQSAVTPCLLSACNPADLGVAASVGLGLCSVYSASVASASAHTTAASASSATTSGSSSGSSGSSSSAMSTSTVTDETTSIPMTTSMSSMSGSTSGSSSSSKGSSSSSSKSSSSSASVTSSTSPAAAAPILMAGLGGFVGIVAGFVAAL